MEDGTGCLGKPGLGRLTFGWVRGAGGGVSISGTGRGEEPVWWEPEPLPGASACLLPALALADLALPPLMSISRDQHTPGGRAVDPGAQPPGSCLPVSFLLF